MLFFRFRVLVWLLFLFLLLVVRFIHHCFHVVVYLAAVTKFSIKFDVKMFKPTSSSISSMVGTLWTVNVCIFFVLT